MLVISVGMQKSGSAYYYRLINDLLVHNGCKDATEIKKEYKLQEIMKWQNNNIDPMTQAKVQRLWTVTQHAGAFVVKTHDGPFDILEMYLETGRVKVSYIYRDPRDVIVSTIDHGKKILAAGENHTFATMADIESALQATKMWLNTWNAYNEMDHVFMVKYEDLLSNPVETLNITADYLNLSIEPEAAKQVIEKYKPEKLDENQRGFLHYNKAISGRYKTEMTSDEIEMLNSELGDVLQEMNYAI